MRVCLVTLVCLNGALTLQAQQKTQPLVAPTPVKLALQRQLIDSAVPLQEVQEFTQTRIPPMPYVRSIAEWERFAGNMRKRTLENVVLRGKAAEWAKIPTHAEYLDTIDASPGYVIKKLRFEAVPGMWIPALLYEPKNLSGKVPVVLNVNGHDRNGKAADYKQIRCINQAQRGMIALNLEWVGMGQLRTPGFTHYKMNQLDLCGTSGVAPFYLSMKRGLDVLLDHPNADPRRVAVAGLSGGGWQTIFISSLDERVTLCNPVAGYSSFKTRARYLSDLGDSEQTPSDLATETDYSLMTAMMAPRATLLTNNAEDNCCFRAEHAQPPLVQAAAPIFKLYGRSRWLRTHVNHDPGTHNFQKDNRQQLYKMFGDYFYGGLQAVAVHLDREHLKRAGLTVNAWRTYLPDAVDFQDAVKSGLFAQLGADPAQASDFAPDLVLLISRNFDGESAETLGERNLSPNYPNRRLKDVAELRAMKSDTFDPNFTPEEIPCDDELKTFDELTVPLPDDNQDFHTLALRLMQDLPQPSEMPQDEESVRRWQDLRRSELKKIVSAHDWDVYPIMENEEQLGDWTVRYWWLRIGSEWTVPATEFIPSGADHTCALFCSEHGRVTLASRVEAELNRRHRVIAFDPFYYGESKISQRDFLYGLLVAATGDRDLGIQVSQIEAVARWARKSNSSDNVALHAVGPRMSLAALVASSLGDSPISQLTLEQSYASLKEIIQQDIAANQAPELFVFGLLKHFDVADLIALAPIGELKTIGNKVALQKSLGRFTASDHSVGPQTVVIE